MIRVSNSTYSSHAILLAVLNYIHVPWRQSLTCVAVIVVGELRMKQDEAAAYRASTCFITGIPYTKVPYEKGTDYFQYLYLLLYLRRLDEEDQTKLEEMICDHVNRGEVE